MEDYPRVEAKRQEYYCEHAPILIEEPPADSIIGIPGLHKPDMLVEIEIVAVTPR